MTAHPYNRFVFVSWSWHLLCNGTMLVKPGFHKANYDHDNDQFRVKTKRLAYRMTAQPYNRFLYVSWSWHLPSIGNQVLALCPLLKNSMKLKYSPGVTDILSYVCLPSTILLQTADCQMSTLGESELSRCCRTFCKVTN